MFIYQMFLSPNNKNVIQKILNFFMAPKIKQTNKQTNNTNKNPAFGLTKDPSTFKTLNYFSTFIIIML